jgi:hypothetical protein
MLPRLALAVRAWISRENTTSAEGNSAPAGDTALSMLRLLAAVPFPCDACQAREPYSNCQQDERGRSWDC